MERPEIIVRYDVESEAFVSYMPALNLVSSGSTESEAIAAVFDAAALSFSYFRDQALGLTAEPTRGVI